MDPSSIQALESLLNPSEDEENDTVRNLIKIEQ